ncbi:MAG: hypothetical protein ABIO70_11555 [Pseudomonadota bacterium]
MPLTIDKEHFLAEAWRALGLRALDASKPEDRARYVSIYDREDLRELDPVDRLYQNITWSPHGSAVLFSGYRGSGKSTELSRLKHRLEEHAGAVVVYCDMTEFINMDAPPDVPDLLLATAGAFAEVVERDEALRRALPNTYWERLVGFLRGVHVNVDEVEIKGEPGGVGLGVKLALKSSPSFQRRLQEQLTGVAGALAKEVRDYYAQVVAELKRLHGDKPVVILFDSLEHIQGTGASAAEVASHIVATFNRTDLLRVPGVHVVYTVPPWLKVKAPHVIQGYDNALLLPCLKVRDQVSRAPFRPGLDALAEVVAQRFDWEKVLSRAQLDQVALASGGQFRDLFRILRGVLSSCARHNTVVATDPILAWAIAEVRNGYLPLSQADACWLAEIDRTGEAHLPDLDKLGELARLFDSHLVLTYRNGAEWYRPHPLLAEEVVKLAARVPASGAP